MPKNLVILSPALLAELVKPLSMSGIAQTWKTAVLAQASSTSLLLLLWFAEYCLESRISDTSKYFHLLERFLRLQYSLIIFLQNTYNLLCSEARTCNSCKELYHSSSHYTKLSAQNSFSSLLNSVG